MTERNKMNGKNHWNNVMEVIPNCKMSLGPYFAQQLRYDPRHLLFTFSRYKFAARLLGDAPKLKVLELGCNEGVGSLYLAEVASNVTAVDFSSNAIDWASQNLKQENLTFMCNDFLGEQFGKFDAVVSLDVIEHIVPEQEDIFLSTVYNNLNDNGFCIIGTPNITASRYASEASKKGHINLYTAERLKELFLKEFKNVFIFGMNDEVVHTGFYPMCNYLFALACNKWL